MSINTLELYDKLTNFFHLSVKIGQIREVKDVAKSNNLIWLDDRKFTWEEVKAPEASFESQEEKNEVIKRMIVDRFRDSMIKEEGYKSRGLGRYVIYNKDNAVTENKSRDIFDIFTGFEFRIIYLGNSFFLCVNPHLTIKFNASVKELMEKGVSPTNLNGLPVFFRTSEGTSKGLLIDAAEICKVRDEEFEVKQMPADGIVVKVRPEIIERLLKELGREDSIIQLQRKYSFLATKAASNERLAETLRIVRQLHDSVFPLRFGGFEVKLDTNPAPITELREEEI